MVMFEICLGLNVFSMLSVLYLIQYIIEEDGGVLKIAFTNTKTTETHH